MVTELTPQDFCGAILAITCVRQPLSSFPLSPVISVVPAPPAFPWADSSAVPQVGDDSRLSAVPCTRPSGSPPLSAPTSASLPQPIFSNQGNRVWIMLLTAAQPCLGPLAERGLELGLGLGRDAVTCFLQGQAQEGGPSAGWLLGWLVAGDTEPDFRFVTC